MNLSSAEKLDLLGSLGHSLSKDSLNKLENNTMSSRTVQKLTSHSSGVDPKKYVRAPLVHNQFLP